MIGINNSTLDSFRDGGKFQYVDFAFSHVRLMILEGADIIYFGAQSTRPMASRISFEEELDRLMSVLEAVIKVPEMDGKFISVETFY